MYQETQLNRIFSESSLPKDPKKSVFGPKNPLAGLKEPKKECGFGGADYLPVEMQNGHKFEFGVTNYCSTRFQLYDRYNFPLYSQCKQGACTKNLVLEHPKAERNNFNSLRKKAQLLKIVEF